MQLTDNFILNNKWTSSKCTWDKTLRNARK